MKQRLVLVFVTVVLGATFLGMWHLHTRGSHPVDPTVDNVVGALRVYRPLGWTVQELTLSETEVGRERVSSLLQYDAAGFFRYTRGGREFSVYVAYWRPGKVDIRSVNAHTPDTCWINNGWKTLEESGGFKGFGSDLSVMPGQMRIYELNGRIEHVAFWHLLGGRSVPMWHQGFPMPHFIWRLFTDEHSAIGREQFFIRLSSPRPLREVWDEPAFQEVLSCLGPSGLIPLKRP